MKTMRILFVHGTTGGLGDTIRVDTILKFLQKLGFNVYNVALPSISPRYIRRQGVSKTLTNLLPFHELRPFSLRDSILRYLEFNSARNFLDQITRNLDFNVILAETSLVGWLTLDIHKKSSKPLIVDVHGLAGAEAKGRNERSWHLKELLEAEIFNRCTHLLVVSYKMKEHVARHFKVPDDKIHVVHNGAEPQNLKAKFSHPLKVIYAGNFAYYERVDNYLEIAKKANQADFKFFLSGAGAMKKHILARIKREKIPIKYLGHVPRPMMLNILSEMQIGIAPSTKDLARLVAFPIKVLDYMSCGLPVITPNIGDWGKMIETKNCGVALEDDSTESYLAALETLKRKAEWKNKSNNGIQTIRTEYNWNEVLSPLRNLMTQYSR
nr:glycosyltransferase family 4 protein [Candidatus Njordarchaeota archaeon]